MPTFSSYEGEEPGIGPPGRMPRCYRQSFDYDDDEESPAFGPIELRKKKRKTCDILTVIDNDKTKTDCRDNPVPEGHVAATEKQIKLAKWMGQVLNLPIPLANSKSIYQKWIHDHKEDFDIALDMSHDWPDYPEMWPDPEY